MSNFGGNIGGIDEVLEFRPDILFDIKKRAAELSKMMITHEKNLIMHLPHISVEFEAGCTRKEIIDGYNLAMSRKPGLKPSNANSK